MPDAADDQAGEGHPAEYTLRNLQALPRWCLALGFLAAFVTLTVMLKTRGTEWRYPIWLQWGAVFALWTGGYLGVGHFLRRPCTILRVQPDGDLLLTRVWLWRVRRDRIPRAAVTAVEVREERDSEGDPYFRTRLLLATGEAVTVQQGHRRTRQRAIAQALRAALGLPG